MKTYKINGREIPQAGTWQNGNGSNMGANGTETVLNQLLEALGEPIENTGQCNECFDGFHENCINLLKVCACKSCTKMEEKPKWDKNNIKVGGKYFCLKEVGGDLRAQSYYWRNDEVDKFRIATNNIFETYGEAENYKRKILGE